MLCVVMDENAMSLTIAQVRRAAPDTPACFVDREAWLYYLLTAQQNSKPTSAPFKNGIFRPEFSHCADCTLAHSTAMARVDRCNPSQFRVIPIKKEQSYECA